MWSHARLEMSEEDIQALLSPSDDTIRSDALNTKIAEAVAALEEVLWTRAQEERPSKHLERSLEVFLEPVNTTVLATVPRHRPFVEVLDEHCQQWAEFIRPGEDEARRSRILTVVSDSTGGVADIETEQCREQEQEKEQEQEQEQEIEMERCVHTTLHATPDPALT